MTARTLIPDHSDEVRAIARQFLVETVMLALSSPICERAARRRVQLVMPILCTDAGGDFGALRNAADTWAYGWPHAGTGAMRNALMRLLARRNDQAAARLGLEAEAEFDAGA